jgi:hypothetical protein
MFFPQGISHSDAKVWLTYASLKQEFKIIFKTFCHHKA